MPFARWIKNQNNRPVCVWNDDMKMSLVHSREILPVVKREEVFAVLMKAPFDKLENIRHVVDAKHALFSFCKLAA